MIIVLGILAAIGLVGIIYLFKDEKSSRLLKLSALGALILIGLTIIVCSILLIFFEPAEVQDPYAFPIVPPQEQTEPQPASNILQLIIFLIISILLLGFIVYIYMKQHKKHENKDQSKNKSPPQASMPAVQNDFAEDDFNFDDSSFE